MQLSRVKNSKFLEYQASVVSTKAKVIAHSIANIAWLCLIECKIQLVVDVWIVISFFVVDGRSDYAMFHRQNRDNRLYRTRST